MSNTSVALLWHFHQPIYSKPDDCTMPMPWVRLHCLKDYLDMLKHVQNYPEIHVTFNFTPSLLMQIDDYRTGKCTDKQFLLFQKKASELTFEEKKEILRDFFLANWERMIEINKRYFSLLLKRGKNIVEKELDAIAETFTENEILDLQIWANLVWIDPLFRNDIHDLYVKGKNFTEQDKQRVIDVQNKIISQIIDEYKKAFESGQIELSTSPLYHPILPLLIDSELAKVSNPKTMIPFHFQHPEDARVQIEKGIKVFENLFGQRPKGMWPSEGSVCQELIPMLEEYGIKWIATDEEILARSLQTTFRRDETGMLNRPELLYKTWKTGKLHIVFRDHMLSDRIGFLYNQWDQIKAADDLTGKILNIQHALPTPEDFIIPIILDGENAWESFENDGTEFIDTLYKNFLKHEIQTTTISEYIAKHGSHYEVKSLFPGSWIGGNFNIWIGHPEDQKAWQLVKNLRDKLVEKNITDEKIWERFYILEGSDWYWWFGEEHYSAVAEIFDELFRLNAIWIYKQINEEPPPELYSMLKQVAARLTVQPNDRMTPQIDGDITHFYEWYHAGHADVMRMGGTMHRFAGLFSKIYCGFDENNLYVRFDIENHDINKYEYKIKFFKPKDIEIIVGQTQDIDYKIKKIGEVTIPMSMLSLQQENEVKFIISAQEKGTEIDRTPLLTFTIKLQEVKLQNWSV